MAFEYDDDLMYDPTPKSGPNLPKLPASPDFRLAAHTNKWSPDLKSGRMLPDLVTMPMTPGACGVARPGDLQGLIGMYEPQGWTFLAPEVMGEIEGAPKHYVHKKRVARGVAHLPVWVHPVPGSDRVRVDRALYRRFVEHVADKLPQPNDEQLETMLSQAEATQAKYHERGLTNPLAKRRAEEWAAKIEIIAKALARARGEDVEDEAPAPAPTPAPKKAPATKKAD